MNFFKKFLSNRNTLFFLITICLIAYYPAFYGEYTSFDDSSCILKNKYITQPFDFDSLINIFTSYIDNQYTPLSITSYWLEYNLFLDFNSYFSHIVNFLIHLTGVILLYYLLLDLYKDNKKIALIFSALWAIHPIQAFSVDWLIGRRTILYGTFFIASLLCYTKYITTNKKLFKYLALLTMILSGLSKTLAFSAPIVWLGIDWLKSRKFNTKIFTEKITAFIIALTLIVVMFSSANNNINKDKNKQIDYHYKESMFSISYYVIQTLYPHDLYAMNELNDNTVKKLNYTYIYFILFLALFTFISTKSRLALFGFLFYLFHIFPLSGLIRVGYSFFISYHYNYIPLLGILLVIIEGYRLIEQKHKKFITPNVQISLFLIIIILLIIKTNKISTTFQNSEKLLLSSIENDEYNLLARRNLIIEYLSRGNTDKAEFYLKKMFSIYSDNYLTYYLNAFVIFKKNNLKELDKAIESFKKANELDPTNTIPNYSYHIALCYQKLHNWQQAEYYFTKQITITPKDNMSYLFRAYTRRKQGKYLQANEDYSLINQLTPNNQINKINLIINNLQMINYYKSFLELLNLFNTIKEQEGYQDYYFKAVIILSYKTGVSECFPYYTYFNELCYKINKAYNSLK